MRWDPVSIRMRIDGRPVCRPICRPLDQAARTQLERLPVITLEPGAEITPLLAAPTWQIGPHPMVGRPHTPPGPVYGVGTVWVFFRRRWTEKAAGSRLSR